MIYSKIKIITKRNNSIKQHIEELKEFNNIKTFMTYKKSLKYYIETRKDNYDEEDGITIFMRTWIKDPKTKDTWEINSVIDTKKEIIISEEEQKYLKDKIWDKEKGWTKEITQREFTYDE